jgi:hypothetical protein
LEAKGKERCALGAFHLRSGLEAEKKEGEKVRRWEKVRTEW